jgi:thiamine biosynthesis lipoprotein ApbE
MDSICRYHVSVTEDGYWNVIDSKTGGPAELEVKGVVVLLYRMPEADAKALSKWLNRRLAHRHG